MSNNKLPKENSLANTEIADYVLEDEIGRGKNGVVYKAHSKQIPELLAAIKFIPKSKLKTGWEIELKKVALLSSCSNVIQPRDQFIDNTILGEDYLCIFWEFIEGQNLKKFVEKRKDTIDISFVLTILQQLLIVFIDMQDKKIEHNDLHPGNIIITFNTGSRYPDMPILKVGDFGIGGSNNELKPKNDFDQLAKIVSELLNVIDDSNLSGKDKFIFDNLVDSFIPKKLLESNLTVGNFVRNSRRLLELLETLPNQYDEKIQSQGIGLPLSNPFDYLSCEEIGNSFEVLNRLYSNRFPGQSTLMQKTNTILTGPRGCGKTTIFKNMSLKVKTFTDIESLKKREFIGIYYHCIDLYFAFPRLKDEPTDDEQEKNEKLIIHYFNTSILAELIETIILINEKIEKIPDKAIERIQGYIADKMEIYEKILVSNNRELNLSHLKSFFESTKNGIKKVFDRRMNKDTLISKGILPIDCIKSICEILKEEIKLLTDIPFYFYIDDYSTPRISVKIQSIINSIIFQRYSECFFKVSTESMYTFYPKDMSGKYLQESREYDLIDLGEYFLNSPESDAKAFLREVINNRLSNSKQIDALYQDIEKILGPFNMTFNDLALAIRNSSPGKKVHYYGWDMICELCSGDIVNVLRSVRDIIANAGGIQKLENSSSIKIPISETIQDKAIREMANDFINTIANLPKYGGELKKITENFGYFANWLIKNEDSKNQEKVYPKQTYRIEIMESFEFNDTIKAEFNTKFGSDINLIKAEEIYKDLIRYGIFLKDDRGKSIRGHVVPRLYLRRLILPSFLLTPNKRDNIGLEPVEFLLLLDQPEDFYKYMKSKKRRQAQKKQENNNGEDLFNGKY